MSPSTPALLLREHVNGAEPVEGRADIVGDLVLGGDVGRDRQCFRGFGQILDRGLQALGLAVDGDDARAALGQQMHGRGADVHAGSPGNDGNLAVQGEFDLACGAFPRCSGCIRIFTTDAAAAAVI